MRGLVHLHISPPGIHIGAAQIAPQSGHAYHACCMGGLYVAQIIANVQAMLRRNSHAARGLQQGRGVRLGLRQRIAADDNGRIAQFVQPACNRLGKTGGLVGHNAPK